MGIDLPVTAGGAQKVVAAQDKLAKATQNVNDYLLKHPDAVNASSKAHDGYEKALGKVHDAQGHLNDVSTAGGTIMADLKDKIGGQAAAAADTLTGKTDALKAQMTDLGAKLGAQLIPVLVTVMGVVEKVVGWFEKHHDAAVVLGIVLGTVLVGALAIMAGSFVAATIAAAPLLVPILGVIAVIGLLGVVAYALYQNWDTIWSGLKVGVNAFVGFFTALPGRIASIASTIWTPIENAFKDVINGIITAWNWLSDHFQVSIHIAGAWWHPGLDLDTGTIIPKITPVQTGGFVTAGGLAFLHPAEVVVPAPQVAAMGGPGINVTLNVGGSVVTEREITEAVRTQLVRDLRSRTDLFS
jgi:hypothetical protein